MIRIGLDIDGCFADFNSVYARMLAEENRNDLLPQGWQSDDSAFITWDWDRHYGYPVEVQRAVWEKIRNSEKFWEKLPPLAEAREVLRFLNPLSKSGDVDVYFITNRMGLRCKIQTERWFYEHGFDYPTVLISADKVPIIKSLNLNLFVDDRLDTMKELMTTVEREGWGMIGKKFLLKDAPWNRDEVVPNLKATKSVKDALVTVGVWK